MIMNKHFLLIVSAAVLISSCSKNDNHTTVTPVNSEVKTAAKCGKTISGSISYAFTTAFDLPCSCGSYTSTGNYAGSGTLTHLGLTTSDIKPCVSPLPGGVGYHVGVECGTLVSASGDQVYTNILPYDILLVAPNIAVGTLTVEITGGTGRFEGASGSFTGVANVYFATGTALLNDINGTINY